MKKLKSTKIILIAFILIAISIASCKKYLSPEPVSSFDNSLVFGSSVALAKSAVIGAYNSLTGDYGYGIRVSMYYPYDSDEMMGAGGTTDDGERRNIARYYLSSSNTQLSPVYSQFYAGIERSNICIYNIPKMDLYNTGSAQAKGELRRLYGEALTLRAQYYFELIRNWGDIPEQRLPSALLPNLFLPKTDRDTIYNHILNDLLQAESLVPWRTEIGSVGDQPDERITKGTVKGLRARIALFRGGYSLRKASGVMERRSDYKTYYQIALTECTELMARRDQHTLNPSYKSIWKDYICGHNANDPSGELLFQVAMGGQTSTSDSKLGTYNGTKFGTVGGGALAIMPTYFYMFDSTDVRRDVVAVPYETNTDLTTRKGHAINAIVDGKWRKEWISNPAFTPGSSAANLGLNWVILRFSDILLMYAEADNEINGAPNASDIAAVNEVSKRAHGGNQALVPTIPTDYTGFFKYIVRERMLEFGSEGIRKYDLIRWNLLTAAITETKANLANMGAATPVAMAPFSYMASPPAYCLVATLPKSMYYINTSTADDAGIWKNSLYKAAPSATPTGTTKVSWVGSSGINTSFTTVFAYAFKTNHSELLPLGSSTLNYNYALTQDYGY
jgi:starch-binding outer membrane protein, SusD/RagB family